MNTLSSLLQKISGIFTTNGNYEINGKDTRETISALTEAMYMRAGSMIVWPGPATTIPEGWHLCDGISYPISNYGDLFNALGAYLSPYGVNVAAGTFQIPNIEASRTIVQGNSSTYKIGDKGGTETVGLEVKHLPRHNHIASTSYNKLSARGLDVGGGTTSGGIDAVGGDEYKIGWMNTSDWNNATIQNVGDNTPHPNMSPYIAMNWIIKLY